MKIKKVLVTGGAGYIGSHTCVELLQEGYDVVCADNFVNSSPIAMDRVAQITGKTIPVHELDFCDYPAVKKFFTNETVDAVIHFAGHKAVGESVENPLKYYENNLLSLINLCKAMGKDIRKNLVFSSSATVYGFPDQLPIEEDSPVDSFNPYGRTKLFIEQILQDIWATDNAWNISILRYFNPVAAHPSGLIGEDPAGIPNNLMPYIAQVAIGRLERLRIFGADYDTPDGTGVRDFIHVVDLAKGHVAAMRKLETSPGLMVHNLGTGRGYSVLELVNTFAEVNNVQVPYEIVGRRPGDVAANYASTDKAKKELGWEAQCGIRQMVLDTWNWQSKNPNGYSFD
ncbi:UDP-glucose 4-epimerase GalE [Pseudodesulfovibrio cashew]|uniref:UDP-glucose 4-epimerase n=1 Tax=Pseudodesulfovibrio cashew TaxID=2678688 RepID=A0A6I6JDD4_9BACT|nr:UDP-glucose 4-epimerase GalE [Pseudodesulfovibrio cashew]QGY39018.1 UDP-glucose 4-epimerase GalE [Pseudodesulfovibrio cashew]